MASLEHLNNEIKLLLKENKRLSEELNAIKDINTYYKNRCKLLRLIIQKFKDGIKRIIN
jgi:cell shape-determining protein MreC